MKFNSDRYPLVKLPQKIDYCLYLIKEELKSRRFFEGLHSVGLDDVYLQPDYFAKCDPPISVMI
ncbi:hypothetical protein [Pseudochryseolinea flava]|uniref:Uncharacterized protein n=1 Tax=Pseudochryseolinea flava TaxID=2059302 RepID=A0A364XTY0_9BACT|nr:hypothetical protein [Pseudochryseolinea flava]RAV97604.1 hypothetical protein DQQ10_27545 [Pseudochryseolinea flava]